MIPSGYSKVFSLGINKSIINFFLEVNFLSYLLTLVKLYDKILIYNLMR